ncbi:MAG: MotA/TolQ/ExbB proton channel family protein [Candidatus Thiodiazotropha taylori]|nr:MotA/TolQ/ExbB proton channel family protein [Candidatus Thiodiazotropha taylori]
MSKYLGKARVFVADQVNKVPAWLQALSRDVRRFILKPKRSDVFYFVALLLILGFVFTLLTSLAISGYYNVPRQLSFNADATFCDSLLEQDEYEGIKCKLEVIPESGIQANKFYFFDDNEDVVGRIELRMSYGFTLLVIGGGDSGLAQNDSDILADELLIDRSPLLWNSGLFSTKIRARTENYASLITAALNELNESSEIGWSDSAIKEFSVKLTKRYLSGFLEKARAIEKASSYTSVMPLLIYFAAWVGLLGYIALGAGSLYAQHYLRTRVPDTTGERLAIFDFIIDSLPAIGLVGTVLGMIYAMGGSGRGDDPNFVIAKISDLQLNTGIYLALYTTLLGISLMLVLRVTICLPFNLYAFHRQTQIMGITIGGSKDEQKSAQEDAEKATADESDGTSAKRQNKRQKKKSLNKKMT